MPYFIQFLDIGGTFTDGRGTFTYMDPQTLRMRGDGRYDQSCDFYSYCCLAYEVLSGEWLPRITKFITLMKMEVNRRPEFPDSIPINLRKTLLSGFEEDLDKRAGWDDAMKALSE